MSTAELAVIAAALETAPVLLQYPVGVAESAEYLPGKLAPPYDAARWWGGEAMEVGVIRDAYAGLPSATAGAELPSDAAGTGLPSAGTEPSTRPG